MFDDLNDNNIDLYMMRMYENTQCVDIDEYYDDLKRIKYIKRLFNRYLAGDELKERLILNHIIILYNVFDRSAATRILFTKMESKFQGIKSAEGWQLSNAPILGMAPLKASMEIYDKIGIKVVREKSIKLSSFLEYLIKKDIPEVFIITPANIKERGSQLSLLIKNGRSIFDFLSKKGIVCDWREPDVIRVTPHPLFNTYTEVFNFVQTLRDSMDAR